MKAIVNIFLLTSLACLLFSFSPDGKKKVPKYFTYFGCAVNGSESISAEQFKALMKERMCAKDENGKTMPVSSFEITYAETGLFQDSAGLPLVVTDYSFSSFKSDTLTAPWKRLFTNNIYKGDTLKISQVRVKAADGKFYRAEGINIVIN